MYDQKPDIIPSAGVGRWPFLGLVGLVSGLSQLTYGLWFGAEHLFGDEPFDPGLFVFFYRFSFTGGFLLGLLISGPLCDNVGHRRIFAAAAGLQGLIFLIGALSEFQLARPLEGLLGLSAGAIFPACFKIVWTVFTSAQRPAPLFLVIVLAPASGRYLNDLAHWSGPPPDSASFRLCLLFGLVMAGLGAAVMVFIKQPPTHPDWPAWGHELKALPRQRSLVLILLTGVCCLISLNLFTADISHHLAVNERHHQPSSFLVNMLPLLYLALSIVAVYVQIKGQKPAWALLTASLIFMAAIFPLSGGMISNTAIMVTSQAVHLSYTLNLYLIYLLAAELADWKISGTLVSINELLAWAVSLLLMPQLAGLFFHDEIVVGHSGLMITMIFIAWLGVAASVAAKAGARPIRPNEP